MGWESTTFKKSAGGERKPVADAISRAIAKHRDAMTDVIGDAKRLADERRRMLNSIQDPQLKRSAAR